MSEDQAPESSQSPTPQFDAFVSYHGPDRKQVEWVCEQLAARGVRVWVDYEHSMAGRPLLEVLGEAIKASQTGVVVFGSEGIGKWQEQELRMLVSLHTEGKIGRLVPVLLPGVEKVPDQLGLCGLVAVRFAESLDEPDALDQLEEAITGRPPRAKWEVFEILREVPSLGKGCFVASPLEDNDTRYKSIARAIESAGMELLQFRRSDQGRFCTDVAQGILAAKIVVVDAAPDKETGLPAPEVLYEWGVADALGKPIIVLDHAKSEFPIVASARRSLEYEDGELGEDGSFQRRLVEEIRNLSDSLHYPFLTETGLDDTYSHHVRFICFRPAIWRRLCSIIHFGIGIHDQIREVTKHAHKLEQDVQRVYEDLDDIRQLHNSRLHARNWDVLRKTFSKEYLRAHASFDELFLRFREREQDLIENAFQFLMDYLPEPLVELARGSYGYYRRTLNRTQDYFANHEDLRNHMGNAEEDGAEGAGHLKNLCAWLSEYVNEIDCQVSRMITTLLEVIAREQKPIGGESDVSHANQ